jgi:hypothetical protein
MESINFKKASIAVVLLGLCNSQIESSYSTQSMVYKGQPQLHQLNSQQNQISGVIGQPQVHQLNGQQNQVQYNQEQSKVYQLNGQQNQYQ